MPEQRGDPAQPDGHHRRGLLLALGITAGAAAAGRMAHAGTAERATLPGAKEDATERVKARYQFDAPDVQAFYRTNRY